MKIKILLLAMSVGASLFNYSFAVTASMPTALNDYFPAPPTNLVFQPFRSEVYTAGELLAGCVTNFDTNAAVRVYQESLDWQCYTNVMVEGTSHRRTDLSETTLRYLKLHDLAIEEALDNYLKQKRVRQAGWKGVVGIMGGHGVLRQEITVTTITNSSRQPESITNDATYMQIALLAKNLSEEGFTVVTGGGPGVMEAGNLGAWFAGQPVTNLRAAVRELTNVPTAEGRTKGEWLLPAFKVIHDYPRTNNLEKSESIAVPTWFYGFEPPNPFATHIAKYFENSLREEHLLAIAQNGIVFAPGGAGTVQEIFQSACQNYYTNYAPKRFPMILYDVGSTPGSLDAKDKLAWPLLKQLGAEKNFGQQLKISENIYDITEFIRTNQINQIKP